MSEHDDKRARLLENLPFLTQFQNNPKNIKTLFKEASKNELHLLLDIIHWITTGIIKLKKEFFVALKKKRKFSYLTRHFQKTKEFSALKRKTRAEQLRYLIHLAPVFSLFIACLK